MPLRRSAAVYRVRLGRRRPGGGLAAVAGAGSHRRFRRNRPAPELAGGRSETPLDLPRRRGRLLRAGRRRPRALHDGRRGQDGISLRLWIRKRSKRSGPRRSARCSRTATATGPRHAHGGRRPRLRPRRPGRTGLRRGGRRRRGLAQKPQDRPRRRDVVRMGLQRIAAGGRRPRRSAPPAGRRARWPRWTSNTGEVLWRSKEWTDKAAYSSVVATEVGGVRLYVQMTGESVAGVAADDGRLLWRCKRSGPTAPVPTPITAEDCVYVDLRLQRRLPAAAADRPRQGRDVRRAAQEQEHGQPPRRRPADRRLRLRL